MLEHPVHGDYLEMSEKRYVVAIRALGKFPVIQSGMFQTEFHAARKPRHYAIGGSLQAADISAYICAADS
jgi:hypothetical protein